MNLSETAPDLPPDGDKKQRQHWPIEIKSGSVVVKVYRVWREAKDGKPGRHVFNVAYKLPSGRVVKQRGTLERAKEHARLVADSIASGQVEAAEMSKNDRMELLAMRERAAVHKAQPLHALDEWLKARELVGTDLIPACEAWKRRLSKFTRISVHDAVEGFEDSFIKRRRSRAPKGVSRDELVKLLVPKSYKTVLSQFKAKFKERYLDDLKKGELDEWFLEKASSSGWTANTYRKRIVTLFHWARRAEHLPRDMVTEADQTERSAEDAPRRELTKPETLGRILYLLQHGIDLENPDARFDPRPELVPPIVLSAFSGYRSSEGHAQSWEDLDLEEFIGNVTKAKRGTAADRATLLPQCALDWLQLTPAAERRGQIHGYKTEIHTIIRNHLRSTVALDLPPNTFRKSWESYRVILSRDDGDEAADQAGHSKQVSIKHYRNSRAKRSAARAWFLLSPGVLNAYAELLRQDRAKAGTLKQHLERMVRPAPQAGAANSEKDSAARVDEKRLKMERELQMVRNSGLSWAERREWIAAITDDGIENED